MENMVDDSEERKGGATRGAEGEGSDSAHEVQRLSAANGSGLTADDRQKQQEEHTRKQKEEQRKQK